MSDDLPCNSADRPLVHLDAVDCAPILALVKSLAKLNRQLARRRRRVKRWDSVSADMYFRIGDLWMEVEAVLAAAGLAHLNPVWLVEDKRRTTAVEALRKLVPDWRNGPFFFKLRAEQLDEAVELLEELCVPLADATATPEWTRPDSPARWAKVFGFSTDTLKRRFEDGTIRNKKLSTKSYQIAVDDLPVDQQSKFRNAQNPPAK
jgi:hypothetical protein